MMTAAHTASRARACKRKRVCVARRQIPEDIEKEVDRRLKTDKPPVARWIARDMKAKGKPIGEAYVQRRAIALGVPLPSTGRPKGSKNDPSRPAKERKPRATILFSKHRDEARRMKVEGLGATEIAAALGISRQAVYKLLAPFPDELLEPGSDETAADNGKTYTSL